MNSNCLKVFLFVLGTILIAGSPIFGRASNKKLSLSKFYGDFGKYKPNAPWIINDFEELALEDFGKAFIKVISILTDPDKRWHYFCDNKKLFNQELYWHQCLWQCVNFDKWISRIKVDLNENVLTSELSSNDENFSLFNYFVHLANSDGNFELIDTYFKFYAFHVDCLSHFFCQSVYQAHDLSYDKEIYKSSLSAAKKCYRFILKILPKLKSSEFYGYYQVSVRRYQEIIKLLEQKK